MLRQKFDNIHRISAHGLRPSSTQPQPAQPLRNTIYSNARSCSPDDGHDDARNMLRKCVIPVVCVLSYVCIGFDFTFVLFLLIKAHM